MILKRLSNTNSEAYEQSQNVDNKRTSYYPLIGLGDVNKFKKNYKTALQYYLEGYQIANRLHYKSGIVTALKNIGETYSKLGNTKKALFYAEKSLNIAYELDNPGMVRDIAKKLETIYIIDEKWKKAHHIKGVYHTMKDSILNRENENKIILSEFTYNLEKKEKEVSLLNSQNKIQELKLERNKRRILFITIGGILLLLTILLGINSLKKTKKINLILSKQNQEKSALLQEIHHRIKNNLQIVNSLLKMQSREIHDEKILSVFEEAQKRVLSMALLHEKMYQTENLQFVDVSSHLHLLIEDLVSTYAVNKEIDINLDIQKADLSMKTLVPLGLIINEMITNSLKYAFKDRNDGKIWVKLSHLKNDEYELIVGDDGVGFSEEKKGTGIGTKLIDIFIKQLKGLLNKLNTKGTSYQLIFSDIKG